MKKLTAIYRNSKGNLTHLTREDCSTKQELMTMLHDNGIRVTKIVSEKQIQEVLNSHWSDINEPFQEYIDQVLRTF